MTISAHPIGAHVPASGGLAKRALPYAERAGATTMQVFVSNPRGWALAAGIPAQDEAFRAHCHANNVPTFVHATFLVNLGSPTEATVTQSVASLTHAAERARAIGARGVVFHAGSAVASTRRGSAMGQLRETLLPILDALPDDGPDLLVEPTSGGGFALAARLDDLGPYFDAVDHHPRLGVCLDTQHAWAAGMSFETVADADELIDEIDRTVGLDRLACLHLNDSKVVRGAGVDRHDNVGRGAIGRPAFRALLGHPALQGLPAVLEVPGTDNQGPDARELRAVRRLHAEGLRLRATIPS